jgi:hypothetical protein
MWISGGVVIDTALEQFSHWSLALGDVRTSCLCRSKTRPGL